ncbi:hypothetical protein KIPE111705_13370 [Kibdelosporangium persicum]|uniref:hypothetical protein n=1 Tax=Kibdelosporangium persicum TaxID=2698649 RepID=UPI0015661971|nr:hypothetical protein [Kibdelosporangium persicum]
MTNGGRAVFGPIDPWALLPTAALVSVAVVLFVNGVVLGGLIPAVLAVLIVAFDSWANRSERATQRRSR